MSRELTSSVDAAGALPVWSRLRSWEGAALLVLLALPIIPGVTAFMDGLGIQLEGQLARIFIFALLALGLNLQVGQAGLLQLGIAAFFAIGAYTCGILTVDKYPFQLGFWGALIAAPLVAAMAGLALGAPTIRLRGDYLAIVTLGFGEVVRVVLVNLENITDGPRGLNPIPPPLLPEWLTPSGLGPVETRTRVLYYISLIILAALVVVLRTLERLRIGRAFVALREDELVSACMGMNPVQTKLAAFAAGAGLAGLAGALYATNLASTADPSNYDFNLSIMTLCALIIGGLGSIRGVLLGSFVLLAFDNVLSPMITKWLQGDDAAGGPTNVLTSFSNWRWIIFGTALVLMMRFRPKGLWPESAEDRAAGARRSA
ncbi:MAG: branched-chain amino acid ABC transporter permease [Myxococcales bacterium]|nr:branched-chain amino acid ABC transporter permease [Myxococcales bacterium]